METATPLFFHVSAFAQRKKNWISGLFDVNGSWCSNTKELIPIITDYFVNLFDTSSPTSSDLDNILTHVNVSLTEMMKLSLEAPYTCEEIKFALFKMNPVMVPGRDCLPAIFFQKLWSAFGDSISDVVLKVLNGVADVSDWNNTLITLIPKVASPTEVKHFRPISLYSTVYKLVSKVIVNRMRGVLDGVVDQSQSAFVLGRLISDNILIGFECMHWLRKHKGKKDGYAALKLDMRKAYDQVEWIYLEAIMRKIQFPERFVKLITNCVSTVTYSFNLNQKDFGKILPTRGLQQGDPLSPFLFVLCAQGLSFILQHHIKRNSLQGIHMGLEAPMISHLFFADDNLVFFKATMGNSLIIRSCLVDYGKASWQIVNFEKSAVTFSPSTRDLIRRSIAEVFKIEVVFGHSIYLGLPTFTLHQKKLQFDYLHERVGKKLEGWKGKLFSSGGKEVLIKSVIQSIPSYTMSCFRIPIGIYLDIERQCARFWWRTAKGLHWLNWKDLCRPKKWEEWVFKD